MSAATNAGWADPRLGAAYALIYAALADYPADTHEHQTLRSARDKIVAADESMERVQCILAPHRITTPVRQLDPAAWA